MGLLLLSQEQISAIQLEAAIEHQRTYPSHRIGHALAEVAALPEAVIAEAVATQWACPVFTAPRSPSCESIDIPLEILRSHEVLPMHWNNRASILHLGFAWKLDYVAMTAIEAVLQCRVKPCILPESSFRAAMFQLASAEVDDVASFPARIENATRVRIIRNYVEETGAHEVRIAATPHYLWVRLFNPQSLDLLFTSPAYTGTPVAI